ncbi:hypothetical protein C8J57DRAFT_1536484 [Mycena rebaudengoi]|nr:hypothetical protein C8J57DRAFT_1536484 [Mycena rebaudengoi]
MSALDTPAHPHPTVRLLRWIPRRAPLPHSMLKASAGAFFLNAQSMTSLPVILCCNPVRETTQSSYEALHTVLQAALLLFVGAASCTPRIGSVLSCSTLLDVL